MSKQVSIDRWSIAVEHYRDAETKSRQQIIRKLGIVLCDIPKEVMQLRMLWYQYGVSLDLQRIEID